MALYFITGNKHKFAEVQSVLPEVLQLDLNLPEIQDLDAQEVIKAKLSEAFKHKDSEFIVEDTSLCMDCLGGLPGPLIKWFLKSLGNEGLYRLAERLGSDLAEAKTIIGYAKNQKEIYFFEGSIKGRIVFPTTASSFGWDPIFRPKGFSLSFAEMSREEKDTISMRRHALNKLKEFINLDKAKLP